MGFTIYKKNTLIKGCAVNHLLWLHVLIPPPDSYRDPLSALFFMYSSPLPPSLLSQRRG